MAGGGSFQAEILELSAKRNHEYRMVLLQFENPYGEDPEKPKKLVIHLRFNPKRFPKPRDPGISKEAYLKAIEILQAQFKKGGRFRFGIMANGYEPIPGKPGEFQSNALVYQKEHSGEWVVYSFPRDL